jgi:hypothetical protein
VFGVMRQLGLAIWHEVCTTDVLMQVGSCLFDHVKRVYDWLDTACNLKMCFVRLLPPELVQALMLAFDADSSQTADCVATL